MMFYEATKTRSGGLMPALLSALLLVGCTSAQRGSESGDANPVTGQASVNQSAVMQRLASADPAQGKRLYLQCRACHTVAQGDINTVGPNLYGLFGKTAGRAEGFSYSDVLLESDVVWTPETLDEWLTRPTAFLPGNRMIFAGVSDPDDRADLIAYLQQATAE